jgi:hypothetical protein
MNASRLISTLKTFSKEEMKSFGKFLASPYHAGEKNCLPLFNLLKKYHPQYISAGLSYEKIYKRLYANKKFNRQVIWNLVWATEKMTKEFLKQEALKKNKFTGTGLLLTEFGKRKLLNNYSHSLIEAEESLREGGIDYDHFDNKGRLENYKQEYYHLTDRIKPMGDSKLKASEYQILLFLRMTVGGLNDLRVLSETFNYKPALNIPLETARNFDLKKIVDYSYSNNYEYAFLTEIYYCAMMMHLEPEQPAYLERIRELYAEHTGRFTISEKRNMMHWIVNYCLSRVDIDPLKYRRIVFESNVIRLKEGLAYYPENQLPKVIYIQILNSALAIGETEWAGNFIRDYTKMLHPDFRNSMQNLAGALLFSRTKEYSKILKCLNRIRSADLDIQEKFLVRTLTSKAYYELNETETLLHYVNASNRFMRMNHSVTEDDWAYVNKFFKYIKKIVLIKDDIDQEEIFVLKNEINSDSSFSNKKWLLDKLDELDELDELEK